MSLSFNSFLARGDFCHLLITFANSLDPDQDRLNVGPDLDLNCLMPCLQSVRAVLEKSTPCSYFEVPPAAEQVKIWMNSNED